jgi:hypothetical protein
MPYKKYTLDMITSRIVNGCYDNAGHARRAIGRSDLSKADKKSAHEVIKMHYKESETKRKKTTVKKRTLAPKDVKLKGSTISLTVQFKKAVTIKITTE